MHSNRAERELKKRQFILNGNMLKVILFISLPLILYNISHYIYGIIDMKIVADMPVDEVGKNISSISMIGHIIGLFTAIGSGMASGCGIVVSRLIGKNNYQKAKTVANTLMISAAGVGMLLIAILLPFAGTILKLCGLSEELVQLGLGYFTIQIFNVALTIFNSVFFSLEKARGATQNILFINLVVFAVKITLTIIFVKVLSYGTTMIAVATLIANLIITVFALTMLFRRKYTFHFSAKNTMFKGELFKPYASLAVPVFLGRFVFSLGKVIVSSNAFHYGEDAPGALGVSNHISGSVTTICNSFEETTSAIISQNIGAGKFDRVTKAFFCTLGISLVISTIGVILLWVFNDVAVGFFTGDDAEYHKLVSSIFYYERFAIIPLGISSSVLSLVYGLGYNKLAMLMNLSRLFVFRVPVLFILIYGFPKIGAEALGIAMMISNCGIGLMAACIAVYCLLKIKNNKARDIVNI